MRAEVLDYLQALNLGQFTVSTELPWTDGGQPLYIKNLRKVYVDQDTVEIEPAIIALNGLNIQQQVTTVRVFMANDAKVQPPNYGAVVDAIKGVRNLTTVTGIQRRECDITTSVDADRQITEFEFRYTKILN